MGKYINNQIKEASDIESNRDLIISQLLSEISKKDIELDRLKSEMNILPVLLEDLAQKDLKISELQNQIDNISNKISEGGGL